MLARSGPKPHHSGPHHHQQSPCSTHSHKLSTPSSTSSNRRRRQALPTRHRGRHCLLLVHPLLLQLWQRPQLCAVACQRQGRDRGRCRGSQQGTSRRQGRHQHLGLRGVFTPWRCTMCTTLQHPSSQVSNHCQLSNNLGRYDPWCLCNSCNHTNSSSSRTWCQGLVYQWQAHHPQQAQRHHPQHGLQLQVPPWPAPQHRPPQCQLVQHHQRKRRNQAGPRNSSPRR